MAAEGTERVWAPDCCSDLLDPYHQLGDLRASAVEVASGGISRRDSQFRLRRCAPAPTCPLSTQTA
jgi:hypothetical protein